MLAMPIAWKGTMTQYAGRLHRHHDASAALVDISRLVAIARSVAPGPHRLRAGRGGWSGWHVGEHPEP